MKETRTSLMNEIDAVSPRFFFDTRDLRDLFGEFGPYNGRYISNYPESWIENLRAHLKDVELSTIEHLKANQLLTKYKDSILVDAKYKYDETLSWTNNVKALQERKTFNDVIADVYESDETFQTWQEKSQDFRENRSRSTLLKGNIGENVAVIKPLLKKGPAAYIIDPYFRPTEDTSIAFLSKLFEEISNSACFRIVLYIRKSLALIKNLDVINAEKSIWSIKEYEQELTTYLGRFIPAGKSLIVKLVDERSRSEENLILHNRFFLTKFGAIDFGKGFDRFNYSLAQIPVHIVDKAVHLQLADWYIDEKAPFGSMDSIEIKRSII
jgi:hypothetical protein